MAALKGYADDSREENRVWAVGGYVGDEDQWAKFESRWPNIMKDHGVSYLHMKELDERHPSYPQWKPRKDHQREIDAFFKEVTGHIVDCQLEGVWSKVFEPDLKRFNRENGLNIHPYSLACYGCTVIAAWRHPGIITEMLFDKYQKVHSRLAEAVEIGRRDSLYKAALSNISLKGLQEGLCFKDVTPLQAADYLAWECRRDHLFIEGYYQSAGWASAQISERQVKFEEWAKINNVKGRRSYQALRNSPARVVGLVWDYQALRDEHESRCGVWEQ